MEFSLSPEFPKLVENIGPKEAKKEFFAGRVSKRCFSCRSRGELGSCKDKFKFTNASQIEEGQGVEVIPCASGWCGKVTEGSSSTFKNEEYDTATHRMCLQRGPSDDEEHCAETMVSRNKVFMCFCRGDLCNSADSHHSSLSIILVVTSAFLMYVLNGSLHS
ncbi:unnamed protein product [Bemisia tabaci]|uniref:Protein sleepless n=1 Tax=Bemisia tabaci TaxID=7038 RepID=A0A9P0F6N6_BEMTA|nr:unnamed protein product [Bemisia tabaci]